MQLFYVYFYLVFRAEHVAARAHHVRAYWAYDDILRIRLNYRPACRHGVASRPSGRRKYYTVAGERGYIRTVAQRSELDAVPVAVDDGVVERAVGVDRLPAAHKAHVDLHPAAEPVFAVRCVQDVIKLIRFERCHKALGAEVNAEDWDGAFAQLARHAEYRPVAADNNDKRAVRGNISQPFGLYPRQYNAA